MYRFSTPGRLLNRFRSRLRHGFTMLELIVVIVILGILALIAIPTFITVQHRSQDSATEHTLAAFGRAVAANAAFRHDGTIAQTDVDTAKADLPHAAGTGVQAAAGMTVTYTGWSDDTSTISVSFAPGNTAATLALKSPSGSCGAAVVPAGGGHVTTWVWRGDQGFNCSGATVRDRASDLLSGSGGAPAAPGYATPPPSTSPTNLVAVPGGGEVTLTWAAVADATGYVVHTTGGGPVADVPTNSRTATISGLTGNTTYTFAVAGTNSGGEGPAATTTATPAPLLATGQVVTWVGSGTSGSADGTGTAATFNSPFGIAVDSTGNVYSADNGNHTIRKITPAGVVSTLAGSVGVTGHADGTGSAATFDQPRGVAVDSGGNVFVTDYENHTIRKITATGIVSTFAGQANVPGYADGTGGAARFDNPSGITIDANDNLYVADMLNYRIRKITPAGVVSTVAGNDTSALIDGLVSSATFLMPVSLTVDSTGNLYVDDQYTAVRKISTTGVVSTVAGSANSGYADGTGSAAKFHNMFGLTVTPNGDLYAADAFNYRIRKITAAGVVTTFAGSGTAASTDGSGTAASFNYPIGIGIDRSGVLYVSDMFGNCLRKIGS